MLEFIILKNIIIPKMESFNSTNLNHLFPQLTLELTKPYIKRTKNYRTIIKPQVLFLNSTLNAFNRDIPDQSNVNNFELDYHDLFDRNRLSGNDRFDNITRFDYGISILKQSMLTKVSSKLGIALKVINLKITSIYQKFWN